MKKIAVKAQNDHLHRISTVRKPILAVAELIWNAFDADATKVEVKIEHDVLGSVTSLRIIDNGHGMLPQNAEKAFGNLGNSWKRAEPRSQGLKRMLHGKAGQGRFKAYSLGKKIQWETCFTDNDSTFEFTITGKHSNPEYFIMDDAQKCDHLKKGTIVTITEPQKNLSSLIVDSAYEEVADRFAPYLFQHPDISLIYNQQEIDPIKAVDYKATYNIEAISQEDKNKILGNLEVIEWKVPKDRSLYLCDSSGIALEKTAPGIQAPGFNFTAYLKSDLIRDLWDQSLLSIEEFSAPLQNLLEVAKETLREHFRHRAAEKAANAVVGWKEEEIYPYDGEPKNILEQAERQVFDTVAFTIDEFLPSFQKKEKTAKRISFRLLKELLTISPSSVKKIIEELFNLPKEKIDQFADLIDKTSLAAIINTSKLVADRMDFLAGLETMLFDPDIKPFVKERSQLHKLIEPHTWIFGEEFHLTISDESLDAVLEKHLEILGKENFDRSEVLREDGSHGIVDLMLSKSVKQSNPEKLEHLIIELKRPNKKIDQGVANQIVSYAMAVSKDERFRDTETKWVFWAVSNDMDDTVRSLSSQRGRPKGIFHEDSEGKVIVWTKTWGEIILNCKARLNFIKEKLEYSASRDSGLKHLQDIYSQYLPKQALSKDGNGHQKIDPSSLETINSAKNQRKKKKI